MKPTRLLSPKQVAAETGWPVKTVYALVRAREIAIVRTREVQKKPRIWITREDLETYIQRHRTPAKHEVGGTGGARLTGPGVELFR